MASLSSLSAEELQRLYSTTSFLLVDGLPKGAEFGIDGSIYAVSKFLGVKLVPPGFHLFLFSSGTSSFGKDTSSHRVGTRHGLFRFIKKKEVIVRHWDANSESLSASVAEKESKDTDHRPRKRRRWVASPSGSSTVENEDTIVSEEYIKSADPNLAPYPYEKHTTWLELTSFIAETCVARVIGFDQRGDALTDALVPSTADDQLASSPSKPGQPMQWGKPRPVQEGQGVQTEDMERAETEDSSKSSEEMLWFAKFDIKKSWPPFAVGEELTTHARDKSWLLHHVVKEQLSGDYNQILSELQLSFILFTQIHNFSALEAYKRLLSLVCRCASFLSPPEAQAQGQTQQLTSALEFYTKLVQKVLVQQLSSLREAFFEQDLPELDLFFLDKLSSLNDHLYRAASAWSLASPNSKAEFSSFSASVWQPFRSFVRERFGWNLESIETYGRGRGRKIHYDLLKPEDASEDLEAEEGEYAPVVVEL